MERDLTYPELLKREATTEPELGVVLDGGAVDHGPERTLDGPGEDGGSLGGAGNPPALLLGGLVEPRLDMVLPRLVEVLVGDQIVVLRHCSRFGSDLGPASDARYRRRKKERKRPNFRPRFLPPTPNLFRRQGKKKRNNKKTIKHRLSFVFFYVHQQANK